ncbi:hypothetical protein EYF80_036834 [Liparis tanakae]|uniref:Uncharacterized protein n=1 Tax=Liparis tanakae TaxID=230148 RepID=A0A4Z2GHX2_9TELE|nr:hypothetical protein EYF80_036834 [Liparis tanakae]
MLPYWIHWYPLLREYELNRNTIIQRFLYKCVVDAAPLSPFGMLLLSVRSAAPGASKCGPVSLASLETRLTRSFCLSVGEREDTGSRTSHFSVTGWRSTPVKGSLIFTFTSNLPPVAFRPSITYETHR